MNISIMIVIIMVVIIIFSLSDVSTVSAVQRLTPLTMPPCHNRETSLGGGIAKFHIYLHVQKPFQCGVSTNTSNKKSRNPSLNRTPLRCLKYQSQATRFDAYLRRQERRPNDGIRYVKLHVVNIHRRSQLRYAIIHYFKPYSLGVSCIKTIGSHPAEKKTQRKTD